MGGESVNEQNAKVEQVTSAGNSWIICRSKTHGGRIYYFNTLTGEAAWNLSDAEIERARKTTRIMISQEDIRMQSCPEPKDPPTDLQDHNPQVIKSPPKPNSSNYSNIITNQFPKQTFPMSPFIIANPLNHLMPIAVNAPSPVFNSNVWAVPPGQQFYFAPTIPPLVNQPTIPCNYGVNIPVNHTNTSISGRFDKLRRKSFDSPLNNHFEKRQTFGQRAGNDVGKKQGGKKNLGNFDLRKVLSAKRMHRTSYHSDIEEDEQDSNKSGWLSENEESNTSLQTEDIADQPPQTSRDDQIKNDTDWLEESLLATDGKMKLNVTNLRKLAKPDMEPNCWYIVTDCDILMNHFLVLNILCDSDEECYLMVPQQVLAELQTAKSGPPRAAARARRALAYISKQLDAGYVVIGDANYKETDTRCDYLISCCDTLLEQKSHVILLSNDDGFQMLKESSKVPIFSLSEVKQFLAQSPENFKAKPDRLKPPPCLNKTNKKIKISLNKDVTSTDEDSVEGNIACSPIKITLNNDLINSTTEDVICNTVDQETQSNEQVREKTETSEKSDDKQSSEKIVSQNSDVPVKKTSEIGIQTDLTPVNNVPFYFHSSTDSMKINFDVSSKDSTKSDDCQNKSSDQVEGVVDKWTKKLPSKKEIRLNRQVVQSTGSSKSSNEHKVFRWRRRRNVSGNDTTDPNISTATSSNNDETQSNDKETRANNESEKQTSDESLLSESSCFKNRNMTNDKIIVEETSTSGIISNTTSNVDSESESGNLSVSLYNFTQPLSSKSAMFEVTDEKMENSLRIMNDELVSRFLQIMEEVMTQILRQDTKFLNEVVYRHHGGGPWTVLEAIDCIRMKFKSRSDVVGAANNLANSLSKISDSSGRINVMPQPSEYMEMYSYGTHMVETLKSALGDCEDLYLASQSLITLLNDIRNPNLDSMQGDTFGHSFPQETSFRNETIEKPEPRNTSMDESTAQSCNIKLSEPKQQERVLPITSSPKEPSQSPLTQIPNKNSPRFKPGQSPKRQEKSGIYNLRSKTTKTPVKTTPTKGTPIKNNPTTSKTVTTTKNKFQENEGEKTEQPVKFVRTINVQDSFFESLNLIKKTVTNDLHNTNTSSDQDRPNSYRSIFDRNVTDASSEPNVNTGHSKIVRKFTICPDFQKNLQEKPTQRKSLDMDRLDYSEYGNDEEPMKQHYSDGLSWNDHSKNNEQNEGSVNTPEYSNTYSEPYVTFNIGTPRLRGFFSPNGNFKDNSPLNINNNLNLIFAKIIGSVKKACAEIRDFCEETGKELCETSYSCNRKCELLAKAHRAQIMIDNLCTFINSIYCRETYEPENNVQSLLMKAGINDFDFNPDQLNVYRSTIGICLDQAKILKESVGSLCTIIKNKPTSLS